LKRNRIRYKPIVHEKIFLSIGKIREVTNTIGIHASNHKVPCLNPSERV